MKTNSKQQFLSKTILAFAIILLLAGGEMWGQNIENNGTIENFGKITLKNANAVLNNGDGTVAGSFDNSAATAEVIFSNTTPSLNNNTGSTFNNGGGTITFGPNSTVPVIKNDAAYADFTTALGTVKYQGAVAAADVIYTGTNAFGTDVTRVMGTVSYERNSDVQFVRNYYYHNLSVSANATKTVQDGVYVSGAYTAADGDRTYQGTFHYDGDVAQVVFGENGGTAGVNRYNNLDLIGAGAKSNTDQVIADGSIQIANTTSLTTGAAFTIGAEAAAGNSLIKGDVIINSGAFTTGSGTVQIAADVNVNADGTNNGSLVLPDNAATVTFLAAAAPDPAGTLTLANNANAILNIGENANIEFYDTFTNVLADRTNMLFDELSTVHYLGSAQDIVSTASTDVNKYGNLITGGAGNKSANGDVYMKGNLTVGSTAPIIMTAGADPTAGYVLDMAGDKTATFEDDLETSYVRGKMNRRAMVHNTEYAFNNAQTTVKFDDIAANVPNTFQLSVLPAVAPTLANNFNQATDVSRTVRTTYTGTGKISSLKIGYLGSDLISFTGAENMLRFAEGYNAGQDHQKLVRKGASYTRVASDPGSIAYAGGIAQTDGIDLNDAYTENGSDPDAMFKLATNSDIILTSTSAPIISVTNGRWTNPNTWDEGRWPEATDNALIRHIVYTGGMSLYGGDDSNTPPTEANAYSGGLAAAHSIEIINRTPTFANPALIVRNNDNTAGYIFKTTLDGSLVEGIAAGIYNKGAGSILGDWNATGAPAAGTREINGLWISTGTNTAIFGTAKLENQGNVINHGEIEIGE